MNNFLFYKGRAAIWQSLLLGYCLLCWALPSLANYHPALKTIVAHPMQQTVSGIVSDPSGPLPGVIIAVKGSAKSIISGLDGSYSIVAGPTDTITFSFIGYITQEIPVGSRSIIDIVLREDATTLQDLEINAGYYSVKDRERTGSISKITAHELENQPVTNILAAMQGRMAGVSITQNTGVPGSGFDIQIRGRNSLRSDGNSPLYIVDGVPYASQDLGSGTTGMVLAGQVSPLNSINPADIASIEVLKDADATAIYGSRGANGVVLVTTKKGSAGKTQFTARVNSGFGKATRFMDLMHTRQYLDMRRQALVNDGISYGPSDYDLNGTWDQNRYTNWQKELLGGTSEYTDANVSISGGSAQTQFLVSGNFHKETTVFPGDFGYKKGNFMSSIRHTSSDNRFKLDASTSYTAQKNNQPGSDLTRTAAELVPNAPALYAPDGSLNWENSTWTNPLSTLESKYRSHTYDLTVNGQLSYELLPGLLAKSGFGLTQTNFDDSRTSPSTMYDPAYEAGSEYSEIYTNTIARRSYIIEPQLDYSHAFTKFRIQALAGATFQQQLSSQKVQYAGGFSSNSLIYNLAAADYGSTLVDADTKYRYAAIYGRINFTWDQKYILNLTGRRDGSSRFGPGRQFATFGAVGAAWLFSRETYLSNLSFLSSGKLRASYGSSGNDQIGDYQFRDTYSVSGNAYGVKGLAPSRLFNPEFGWETNKKFELALETGFFKDRLTLTAAYFRNRSSSQLVGIPLPATTGFSSLQANLDATVENSGLELTLNAGIIEGDNFDWKAGINLTIAKNKLVTFPGLDGSTYQNQYVIGSPLNITKVYRYIGTDPQTGLYQFYDYNNDGIITAEGDQKATIDLNPKYFGGLSNTLSYRGWQLDFLLQFVRQRNFDGTFGAGLPGTRVNQSTFIESQGYSLPYSTGANASVLDAFTKFRASDAAITDTSFLRLKNISLSYTVPRDWLKGVTCRLVAEGQNLFVITPYKGADPESRSISTLPPLRIITTGIQLTF